METQVQGWTLGEIAELVGGELAGPADLPIHRVVPAGYEDPHGITFAESEKYLQRCLASGVGAVLVMRGTGDVAKPAIYVDSPRVAFGMLLAHMARPLPLEPGIHESAVVSPRATIDPTASIGPYAVVEDGALVGPRCRVFAFAYIGENCTLKADCTVFPHAVLYQDVSVGARCIVHAGAVIGADGFGFVWDGHKQQKVPQVGGVVLGDDVEIGANACVDRATCGETTLGDDTKVDNLVQVGHNVSVGPHTVIAALTGIGGSTSIGENVTIAGHVAIADHINIGDQVVLGGRTSAFQDIAEPGQYLGFPPYPVATAMRILALQARLPEMFRRIKQLEDELEGLKRNA